MEPQKSSYFPCPGSKVVEKRKIAKERAAQRVRSRTVQNKIRSVLGLVSTGATRRIFDSANPKEKRAKQYTVSVAA